MESFALSEPYVLKFIKVDNATIFVLGDKFLLWETVNNRRHFKQAEIIKQVYVFRKVLKSSFYKLF